MTTSLLAPILGLVGLVWYIVAAWRDEQRLLAVAAVVLIGIGVASSMGKLDGEQLRYARYAGGLCSLLLLCGAIFHWRKLLLPWLLLVAANVLIFTSGAEAPWMKDLGSHERGTAAPHGRR